MEAEFDARAPGPKSKQDNNRKLNQEKSKSKSRLMAKTSKTNISSMSIVSKCLIQTAEWTPLGNTLVSKSTNKLFTEKENITAK